MEPKMNDDRNSLILMYTKHIYTQDTISIFTQTVSINQMLSHKTGVLLTHEK